MNIAINGSSFSFDKVIYRDQGFGQPSGLAEDEYTISLTLEQLVTLFSEEFNNYVSECLEDDKQYGEIDIPELQELNYPTLDVVLKSNKELVSFLIKEYMYFNFLNVLFGKSPRDSWEYAVNSITDICVDDEGITLNGKCYKIQQ